MHLKRIPKKQKNKKKSKKIQKKFRKSKQKKIGGRDLTRALQSSPLQNPGGGGHPERDGGRGVGQTNK